VGGGETLRGRPGRRRGVDDVIGDIDEDPRVVSLESGDSVLSVVLTFILTVGGDSTKLLVSFQSDEDPLIPGVCLIDAFRVFGGVVEIVNSGVREESMGIEKVTLPEVLLGVDVVGVGLVEEADISVCASVLACFFFPGLPGPLLARGGCVDLS